MFKRVSAVLILLFLLEACGFKLRGTAEIPKWLNHVALITNDGNQTLFPALIRQLETNDIVISAEPSKAKYWLVLEHTNQSQQISGVAASTSPRQYQLLLSVDFTLKTPKGEIVKGPSHLVVMRQLTVNNDRILGSDGETRLILDEMQRDLALQILNRLSM
jgi:LPS-assembly lipoprotein